MRSFIIGGLSALTLASVAAAEPTQRQVELSHRYAQAMRMGEMIDKSMSMLMPMLTAEAGRSQRLPEEATMVISTVVTDVMRELTPKMVAQMEIVVADTFSEEELTAAIAFYETPVGQAIVTKTPQINAKLLPSMQPVMREMQGMILQRLQAICPDGRCAAPPPRQTGA